MPKAKTLALTFLVVATSIISAPEVFASNLYSKSGTDITYTVDSSGGNDGYSYTPAYTGSGSWISSPSFYTATSDIYYFEVARLSGNTCSSMITSGREVNVRAGGTDYVVQTATTAVDGVTCIFGLGANKINSGANIHSINFYNQDASFGTDPVFYGSTANAGYSWVDVDGSWNLSGGIAFRLCDISGCTGSLLNTTTRFVSTIPFNPYTITADLVSGDTDIDVADTSDLYVGQNFSAPQLPTGAYVVSITDSDTFVSSVEPYSTGSYDLIFSNTLPTTETVGASLYVNHDDWVDGMYLEVSFANYRANETGGSLVGSIDSAYADGPLHFDIDEIDTDQVLDLTEEITFDSIGSTRAWFRLIVPCSGFSCLFDLSNPYYSGSILLEKYVDFTVDSLSAFDLWLGNDKSTFGAEESIIGSIVETAINDSFPRCRIFVNDVSTAFLNPFFDFGSCLSHLFIPSSASIVREFMEFKDSVLHVFPLGYITRFVEIFAEAEPIMPPPIEYTFSDADESAVAGTGLEGETISYQIYEHFDVLETIESDQGDHKNIWDIVMPWFNTAVALAVFLVILNDLMDGGFNLSRDDVGPYAKRHVRFSSKELKNINNPTVANSEDEYNLYKKL